MTKYGFFNAQGAKIIDAKFCVQRATTFKYLPHDKKCEEGWVSCGGSYCIQGDKCSIRNFKLSPLNNTAVTERITFTDYNTTVPFNNESKSLCNNCSYITDNYVFQRSAAFA